MEYRVEEWTDESFEDAARLELGACRHYYVFRDGMPWLTVEVNRRGFSAAAVFHGYLAVGNGGGELVFVSLRDREVCRRVPVNGYVGSFAADEERLYALCMRTVMAFDRRLNLLWETRPLAEDGVVFGAMDGETMELSCEMDPPGGWIPRRISLADGRILA